MTDTASAAPSDAEIIALADETRTGEPGRDGYILPISFARAVLAKWGTLRAVNSVPEGDDVGVWVVGVCRAVESEVRKQDDALILQLVEALEGYRRNHNDTQPCDAERAGRARLEAKK